MLNVGVIGYGYWGPNLVRNFFETPGCRVLRVSDLNPQRLAVAQQRYPSVLTGENHRDLIADPRIDAVAIATPVASHFNLALDALRAGKHVLVEKPLAATAEQAMRLVDEAQRRDLVLMVDHTFIYGGAVRKLKELLDRSELGDLYYYDSVRVNLGLFQQDVNVIWDLAVHDLAILDYLLGRMPCGVAVTGGSHVSNGMVNLAYLTLFYDDKFIAHINVNWLAPLKVRRVLIGGDQKMAVYDDVEPSEKLKIYDRGIKVDNGPETLYKMLIDYRSGDVWAPRLDITEALRVETLGFVNCIEQGRPPVSDGVAGMRVVQILEAATESVRAGGRPIELLAGVPR